MLTVEKKNELDALLTSYETTSRLLNEKTADAAMLSTIVQMVREGENEMALYTLHHLKPRALDRVMEPKKEEKDEPDLDLDDLLDFLFN